MSSSTASRLPAVGTTFSSIPLLKLAAFNAAENGSFPLRNYSTQRGVQVRLYCIGNGTKSSAKKTGDALCTCRIYAYKDGKGGYEVKKMVEQHSCRLPKPGSKEAILVRKDTASLIQRVRRDLEKEDEDEDEDEEDEEGTGEEEDEIEVAGASSGSQSFVGASSATTSARSASTSASKQASPPRTTFQQLRSSLSKRLLKDEIAVLARGKPLAIPSFTDLFPSARALLLHIYAWAQQSDLNLNHSPSSPQRIVFVCKPSPYGERCSFEVVICEDSKERWHILSCISQHDSAFHAEAASDGCDPPLLTYLEQQQPRPTSSKPRTLKRQSFAEPIPPPVEKRRLLARADASKPPPADVTRLSDNALSLDRLVSFFTSLSCSTSAADISLISTALLSSDASSISDLSTLLQLEVGTLFAFVEEIKEREGWSEEQALVLIRVLDEAKNMFEEES